MTGKPKIRIPQAKHGYIARAVIVKELTKYLEKNGICNAANKSRTAISDFKRHLDKTGQSDLIINAGTEGKELLPTPELGIWLYNRRKPYHGFITPLCPFASPIIVNTDNLGVQFSIGQVVATGADTYEELIEEMRILTANLVEKDIQLQIAYQKIQMYEKKERIISARNKNNAKKKRPRY